MPHSWSLTARNVPEHPAGGPFIEHGQCCSSPSCTKDQILPHVMSHPLVCPPQFWREEIVVGGRGNLAMALAYLSSWKSWTTCAAWMHCSYHLMLPVAINKSQSWGAPRMNSQWFPLPDWTDIYPWSLTQFVLGCYDRAFPSFCWAVDIDLYFFLLSRRPQYHPLTLKRLQYLIDLGRVDPTQPIDLTQLVNARGVTIQPLKRDYGVQLVDEVFDLFICFIEIKLGKIRQLDFSSQLILKSFNNRLSTNSYFLAYLVSTQKQDLRDVIIEVK